MIAKCKVTSISTFTFKSHGSGFSYSQGSAITTWGKPHLGHPRNVWRWRALTRRLSILAHIEGSRAGADLLWILYSLIGQMDKGTCCESTPLNRAGLIFSQIFLNQKKLVFCVTWMQKNKHQHKGRCCSFHTFLRFEIPNYILEVVEIKHWSVISLFKCQNISTNLEKHWETSDSAGLCCCQSHLA